MHLDCGRKTTTSLSESLSPQFIMIFFLDFMEDRSRFLTLTAVIDQFSLNHTVVGCLRSQFLGDCCNCLIIKCEAWRSVEYVPGVRI